MPYWMRPTLTEQARRDRSHADYPNGDDYGHGANRGEVRYGQLGAGGPHIHDPGDPIHEEDDGHRWHATHLVGWHRSLGPIRHYRPLPCRCHDIAVLEPGERQLAPATSS